eukprot:EG_transcript_15086
MAHEAPCVSGLCSCAEKDTLIRLLKSQVHWLQTQKMGLQAVNLELREQLEECARELEALLVLKEDEVQALRGTCRELSSHAMGCEERAVALQEELRRKEITLRATQSLAESVRWPHDPSPSPLASPRSTHSICVQTSPRDTFPSRTASYASDDFVPLSARGAPRASIGEVQELRYTVRVLKEQLEEWQSAPNSPAHASSPSRRILCPSLGELLDCVRPSPSLDLSGSAGLSPLLSPTSPPTSPPLRDLASPRSAVESRPGPDSLEGQILCTLLRSELCAAEGVARRAVELEHSTALHDRQLAWDWLRAEHRMMLQRVSQLCCLEATESCTPPLTASSPASSVGDDLCSLFMTEEPSEPWVLQLPSPDGGRTPGSRSEAADPGRAALRALVRRHRRGVRR